MMGMDDTSTIYYGSVGFEDADEDNQDLNNLNYTQTNIDPSQLIS